MMYAPSHIPRLPWLDSAKGLAILLVVLGHVWRGCDSAGLFTGMPEGLFQGLDTRIYAFHMPLFFLLSGVFLVPMLLRHTPGRFVHTRATRLLWPLVLWTYLFALSKVVAGSAANTPMTADMIPALPIPGHAHMWFLWALLVLHMVVLALRPVLMQRAHQRLVLWLFCALSVVLSQSELPFALNYWTSHAFAYLPSLAAGMVLGSYNLEGLRLARRLRVLAGAVFLALLAGTPTLLETGLPRLYLSLALCLSLLAALCPSIPRPQTRGIPDDMPNNISGNIPKNIPHDIPVRDFGVTTPQQGRIMGVLATLGAASMAIYLTHTIFGAALRIALTRAGITSLETHILLGTAMGVLLPLGLLIAARRLGLSGLLGFESGPKASKPAPRYLPRFLTQPRNALSGLRSAGRPERAQTSRQPASRA